MNFMENRISGIEDSHRSSTLRTPQKYCYDSRIGWITILNHPEDVPQVGDPSYLVVNPPASNAEMTLQNGDRVHLIDWHRRYKSIVELPNHNDQMLERYRRPLQMYLNPLSDSHALSNMEIMKKSKLLNSASSIVLPCTALLPIILYVLHLQGHSMRCTRCLFLRLWLSASTRIRNMQTSHILHLRQHTTAKSTLLVYVLIKETSYHFFIIWKRGIRWQ